MDKYTVRYEQDEDGFWVGSVLEVKGCHTQGRSIETVRRRIREALALFVKNAETATLIDKIDVPAALRIEVGLLRKMQVQIARESKKAAARSRRLARELAARMSVRDVGAVLGVSGTRVQQLIAAEKTKRT